MAKIIYLTVLLAVCFSSFVKSQSEYQYELERMLEEENDQKARYFNDENENEVRQLADLLSKQSSKDENSGVNVEDVRDFVNFLAESRRDEQSEEARHFKNENEYFQNNENEEGARQLEDFQYQTSQNGNPGANSENVRDFVNLSDLESKKSETGDPVANVDDVRDFVSLLAESLRDNEAEEEVRRFQNDEENDLKEARLQHIGAYFNDPQYQAQAFRQVEPEPSTEQPEPQQPEPQQPEPQQPEPQQPEPQQPEPQQPVPQQPEPQQPEPQQPEPQQPEPQQPEPQQPEPQQPEPQQPEPQQPEPQEPVPQQPEPQQPEPQEPEPQQPVPQQPEPQQPEPQQPVPQEPEPQQPVTQQPTKEPLAVTQTTPVVPTTNPTRRTGRPTVPLRLGDVIVRPLITRRCQGPSNETVRSHCARYLECGPRLFRGAIRTCESGQAFDTVTKNCAPVDKVDCNLF